MRGYAICTAPRSGSNWVGQLLESTRVLGRPLEYFNAAGRRVADPTFPEDPREQVVRILTDGATPNGVYALKVFPWQLDAIADRLDWTRALPDLRYVHLRRRDVVGQAISLYRARVTQQYRSTWRAAAVASYDGRRIADCLRSIRTDQARWETLFRTRGIEPPRLVYEDLLHDPQSAAHAVSTLMGLEDVPAVDVSRVDLTIQRDATTEEWRERFVAEFGERTEGSADRSVA